MTELLLPWCHSLQDLFIDLGGSNPELSSVVMGSIATAAQHGNATRMEWNIQPILSEWFTIMNLDQGKMIHPPVLGLPWCQKFSFQNLSKRTNMHYQ